VACRGGRGGAGKKASLLRRINLSISPIERFNCCVFLTYPRADLPGVKDRRKPPDASHWHQRDLPGTSHRRGHSNYSRYERQFSILRDFDQRYNTFGRSDSVIPDSCELTFHIDSASSNICP
jgi:hypothetical protein